MTHRHRLILSELQWRPKTTTDIADLCGITEGEVLNLLRNLNLRLKDLLSYESDVLFTNRAGAWRAEGIAGLIHFNDEVDLEVVPKFLRADDPDWRSDFFLIALLVKTGHVLSAEDISSGGARTGGLIDVASSIFLRLCEENSHRPIRQYRRERIVDFSADGDLDEESVLLPEADGFVSTRFTLTSNNEFNATMAMAALQLANGVVSSDLRLRLNALAKRLAPARMPSGRAHSLPVRYRKWQPAYELAREIINDGFLDASPGRFQGPGFVLSTWQAWEQLCENIVRRALPDRQVVGQKAWVLGNRTTGKGLVEVKPDISPLINRTAEFLLDAKYRTRVSVKPTIHASDLYEALAFMHASGARAIDLLYPAVHPRSELPIGAWHTFDVATLAGEFEVEGIEVQIQGIAEPGGFEKIVSSAAAEIRKRHG